MGNFIDRFSLVIVLDFVACSSSLYLHKQCLARFYVAKPHNCEAAKHFTANYSETFWLSVVKIRSYDNVCVNTSCNAAPVLNGTRTTDTETPWTTPMATCTRESRFPIHFITTWP
jgi:hypothetical protein